MLKLTCTPPSPLHNKDLLGTKLTSLVPYGYETGYDYEATYPTGTVGNTLRRNLLWIPSLIGDHSKRHRRNVRDSGQSH